ncbi:MAG: DUF3048 domain-containing protein [Lachnospiraceae bacterium]
MIKIGHKRVLSAVLLALILSLSACGSDRASQSEAEKEQEEIGSGKTEETEGEQLSYLTGLPVSQKLSRTRPLAVMFNNIEAGCPQAGIAEASIVYEAPVEGRITRLMGIFEDYSNLEKIGSIRSSRDYFVYFALEYDAIYAHFGQATPYVGELLNSDRVDNISGAVSGINNPAPNAFYRSSDRKAPHNVYLSPAGVLKDIEKFQYRTALRDDYQAKFIFADEENPADYTKQPEAVVLYPGGKSTNAANGFAKTQSRFEYNPEDGLYYRFQYGSEHIDELTGEQLAYTNVIFQYCHGEVRDENDYLAFGCHGDDGYKVQVFTGGKMVTGTWSRSADEVPASYVDEEGNPIVLNPGKTWVCIVWDEYGQDVVIE